MTSANYFTPLLDGTVDRLSRWTDRWRNDYDGKPGFHLDRVNPNLEKHHHGSSAASSTCRFDPPRHEPILVPLCGKTVDLAWLRDDAGHSVVCGVEGVPRAIEELRDESLPELREAAVEIERKEGAASPPLSVWTTSSAKDDASSDGHGWFLGGPEDERGTISIVCGDFFELPASAFPPMEDGGSTTCNDEATGTGSRKPRFGSVFDRGALVAIPPSSRSQYVSKIDELLKPGGKVLLVTLDRDNDDGPPFRVRPDAVNELFRPLGYDVDLVEEHATEVKGKESKEFVFLLTKKID